MDDLGIAPRSAIRFRGRSSKFRKIAQRIHPSGKQRVRLRGRQPEPRTVMQMVLLFIYSVQDIGRAIRREQTVGIGKPNPMTAARLDGLVDHCSFVGHQFPFDVDFAQTQMWKGTRDGGQMLMCSIRTLRIDYQDFIRTRRQTLVTPVAQRYSEALQEAMTGHDHRQPA